MKKWNWMYSIVSESMTNVDPALYDSDEFATCPPPAELDKDGWEWTLGLPVLSAEEMAQMDENADALWFGLMEDTL